MRNRENSGRFRDMGHAKQHKVPTGENVPAFSTAGIPLAKSAPGGGLRLRRPDLREEAVDLSGEILGLRRQLLGRAQHWLAAEPVSSAAF